jgi:hypothetical protein
MQATTHYASKLRNTQKAGQQTSANETSTHIQTKSAQPKTRLMHDQPNKRFINNQALRLATCKLSMPWPS